MQLSRLLFSVALLLAPVAFIGTTWLYLYPIFHGCAFPKPPATHTQALAPFRLLALGDPQLEGDSSLPNPNAPIFPSLEHLIPHLHNAADNVARLDMINAAAKGALQDLAKWLEGKRKAIDLWGNDWYLAHIVTSLRWWTDPTHVAVLGDLLGSQWITDGEFEKRAGRYWNVVMRGLDKVPDYIYGKEEDVTREEQALGESVEEEAQREEGEEAAPEQKGESDSQVDADAREEVGQEEEPVQDEIREEEQDKPLRKPSWGGTTEVLGADRSWRKRVINIAGNHDVGYAGDLDNSRVERFEKAFGSVNWNIWFTLPINTSSTSEPSTDDTPPALRLVILNSMNIDTPAWSSELQTETYSFMNHIITTSRDVDDKTHATILLTHIPLEKQAGICVDSPYFDFFDAGHGVREQNMLSDHSSKTVLQGVFGMSENRYAAGGGLGRRGVIVNGHDHAGCDVVHFIRQAGAEDGCLVDEVKSEEAYWPTATLTETTTEAATGTMDALASDVSSANETNPFIKDTSPASDQETPTEIPEPAADPALGWRAHRFPYLPYSITHNPATNTTTCTSISSSPHIREITLRSMMGEFSGYAGFLSAWFDPLLGENGEWVIEFSTCGVGVQHWWWVVHSVDFSVVMFLVAAGVVGIIERWKDEGVNETKRNRNRVTIRGQEDEVTQAQAEKVTNSTKDKMNGKTTVS